MAKTTVKTSKPSSFKPPPGFEEVGNGDVVGFWTGMTPFQGSVLGVKLLDNSQEPVKVSPLLVVKVSTPVNCVVGEAKEEIEIPAGSIIGVWYKAGMRGIERTYGREVWVAPTGAKDVGKGNPMMVYAIHATSGPEKSIPVLADHRKRSVKTTTPFDMGLVEQLLS